MQLKDITGQRFGGLTAVGLEPGKGWRCRCDCGKETVVSSYSLRKGRTASCGCTKYVRPHEDLTGQTFGDLTVLKYLGTVLTGTQKKHNWLCQCVCGSTTEAMSGPLKAKSGGKKSCGCKQYEGLQSLHTHKYAIDCYCSSCAGLREGIRKSNLGRSDQAVNDRKDLAGQQFGYLTVLGPAPRKAKGALHYLPVVCRCNCGRETVQRLETLKRGLVVSCGCVMAQKAGARSLIRVEKVKERYGDLTGLRVWHLVVVGPRWLKSWPSGSKAWVWKCRCDCGNFIDCLPSHLTKPRNHPSVTKSCGCIRYQRDKSHLPVVAYTKRCGWVRVLRQPRLALGGVLKYRPQRNEGCPARIPGQPD